MNHIRLRFPKKAMLPAAALSVAVGLAFACSESPTEATSQGTAVSFKKGGKPGGNTNDCGFAPLRITFRDDGGDVLRSDNGTAYEEGSDGGVHLNGATGRLMLWTSQNGDPMPRQVTVSTSLFPDDSTTDRIYTNGHESETPNDLGCGFLDMAIPLLAPDHPDFEATEGSAVLEVEMDAEGTVRWGRDCNGDPVDIDSVNERVTTTRIDESTWTIEGAFGVSCRYGPKVRGKRSVTEGPAGAFFITLEKI